MSDVNPCTSDDFWFEVLKKLPVKTLGKCRCVCKSWRALIISPFFITAHLKNYTQNEANSLVLYRENLSLLPIRYERYDFFAEGNASLEACHTSIFPRTVNGDMKFCFHFVGSVHGLVCVADDEYISRTSRVFIWNPLLQKCITLPESAAASNGMGGEMSSVLGLGFNGEKNDHRVVKISYGRGKEESETASPFVEVYSVQEQTWRVIPADYLVSIGIDHIRKIDLSHCFLNGVIHWLTWENPNRSFGNWLLLFDVAEEKFERMALPEALVEVPNDEIGVFVYRSKLSVSHYHFFQLDYSTSSCCRIWVKGEYSMDSSWCMVLNVSLYDSFHLGPVEYMGRNCLLLGFAKDSSRDLVAYDTKTTQTNGLGLRLCVCTKFSAYTESLVLLDHKSDISITPDEFQRSVYNRYFSLEETFFQFRSILENFSEI